MTCVIHCLPSLAAAIAALAVAGMCHALLGSVKVPLARKLQIDEARVGGVGPTTIAMLFRNTVEAAERTVGIR